MTSIKNCQFKFKCHMTWDSLLETSDSKIRYCHECDRGVHFCEDDEELNHALMNDWCVAINSIEKTPDIEFLYGKPDEGVIHTTLGIPAEPSAAEMPVFLIEQSNN